MRIRWTKAALRDFTDLCDYSGSQFGAARARRTALQTHEALDLLENFLRLGRLGRKSGTYELVITGLRFVAVYRLRNDSVEILRVLHGAQRWP